MGIVYPTARLILGQWGMPLYLFGMLYWGKVLSLGVFLACSAATSFMLNIGYHTYDMDERFIYVPLGILHTFLGILLNLGAGLLVPCGVWYSYRKRLKKCECVIWV